MSLKPPKPSPLAPGYRLDRYELLCPIATGGMASVWVARQRGKHGFEKLVAIKTILPEYANDARFQRMFLDEAHIASRIEHVNVAQIRDVGDEHDVLYLVMEWVDGDSLAKLFRVAEKREEPVPCGVVLRILADACAGLHAAHELRDKDGALLGVVHRDVSPQNILVSATGIAKVIDFGIAKARDRIAGDTSTGALKGKVQYMAPEQALGQSIDRRADVWAIGAIAYHLLAGTPPYDADNQLATLHLLTQAKAPKPLPPRVPLAVRTVVAKALAHGVGARYATASELQRALEAAMNEAGCPTSASDVADYVSRLSADRAEARKKAIDLALEASAERARMERLLVPPGSDSSSGIADAARRVTEKMDELSDFGADPRPSALATIAGVAPVERVPSRPDLQALAALPLSENSSATLGASSIETKARDGATRWKIAAGIAAAVALVAVGMAIAPRSGPPGTPAAAAHEATGTSPERAVPASPTTSERVEPAAGATAPPATSEPLAADAGSAKAPPGAPHSTSPRASPHAPAQTHRTDYGF